MNSDISPWTLDPPIAALRRGVLSGRVDVNRPQLGLHDLRIAGAPLSGELLSFNGVASVANANAPQPDRPTEIADAYVRGNDLVAAYRPLSTWPFAPQIYWRAESLSIQGTTLAPLWLLVSMQTDSLDTHPEIRVATRLPAVEVMEVRQAAENKAQALLWRLTERAWSYLEVVPQGDFCELAIGGDADGHLTTEWRLFGDFLEKGVIRRARLLSAFLPRETDETLAAECCRQLQQQPLPLTT